MAHKVFPLLSLPDELLDLVLSYTITIPWHPKNGVYITEAFRNLFGPSLHINQQLRRQTIDIIVRDTLWVQVTFQSREIYQMFDKLYKTMPEVPFVHRVLLPNLLPGIIMSIGKTQTARSTRSTSSFNTTNSTLIFPFNVYSFTQLYGEILAHAQNLQKLTVIFTTVPVHHRIVVDGRIQPILNRLPFHLPTRIVNYNGSRTGLTVNVSSASISAADKIDAVMSYMQDLDRAGHPLEASFLALFLRSGLRRLAYFSFDYPLVVEWLELDITNDDYLTKPQNLERMRIVRTLHHIYYRAFMAHISSAHKYGGHSLEEENPDEVICEEDEEWLTSKWGMECYGLPDHELAQVYYMRARLFDYREQVARSHPAAEIPSAGTPSSEEIIFGGEFDLALQALRHAYVAWRLDKSNVIYAILFKRMVEKNQDQAQWLSNALIDEASEIYHTFDEDTVSTVKVVDANGHERIYGGTLDVYSEGGSSSEIDYRTQNMWRAREIAKRADVVYDKRREDELSKLEYEDADEAEILRYLLCDSETRMKFDRFGVTEEDFRAFEEKERRERSMLEARGTLG